MIYTGDALEISKTLPNESVHCIVTSPPYYGLRDYGVKGQYGLEPSMQEYVLKLRDLFRELKRVLHKSGTLWLNLGDSYASNSKTTGRNDLERSDNSLLNGGATNGGSKIVVDQSLTLKPKNLLGIPWRVAFALQDDGWFLRSDIIWSKANGLPESVKDRPTKAHEYIFLLSKSSRYFYDQEAVKEPAKWKDDRRAGNGRFEYNGKYNQQNGKQQQAFVSIDPNGSNKRTVWSISTQAYSEAHFAVFPPELPRTCIRAGTSEYGVCAECLSPYEREFEKVRSYLDDPSYRPRGSQPWTVGSGTLQNSHSGGMPKAINDFVGWTKTCSCPTTKRLKATVLDPFLGSGTTASVAIELNRNWIGIELNKDYVILAEKRLKATQPGLPLFG